MFLTPIIALKSLLMQNVSAMPIKPVIAAAVISIAASQAKSQTVVLYANTTDSIFGFFPGSGTMKELLKRVDFTTAAINSLYAYTPANPANVYDKVASDARYPLLSGSYSNPSWITAPAQSKITYTGNSSQYVRGDGTLANLPAPGSGTVTGVNAGYGILGGNISVSGTHSVDSASGSGLVSKDRLANSLGLYATTASLSGYLPTSLTSGKILVGNGSGVATAVTPSGDLTISTAGVATLGTTGVSAGSYGIVTVDTKGRVTAGKRQEAYSGTTNGSGLYTVSYGTAYGAAPNVQFQINGGTNKQTILLTSSTTTGFTLYVQARADVVGLLPSYSNVSGAAVDVLVTEK